MMDMIPLRDDETVVCPVHDHARRRPEAPALLVGREPVSYAVLDRRVRRAGAVLHALGVGERDRVAFVLPNGPEAVILLLALLRLGAVACPLSTRLPERQWVERARGVGSRWLITDRPVNEAAGLQVVDAADLARGRDAGPAGEALSLAAWATVVHTSGSTGTPRAAVHALGRHVHNARGVVEHLDLRPGDRWLLSLPMYHVGGLAIVFRALGAGATVVIPDSGEPMGEVLRHHDVTHVSMVATQLYRLLADGVRPGRLRAILLGGGPVAPSLRRRAEKQALPVVYSYGLTEMASLVTATPLPCPVHHRDSSGKVLPGRELSVTPSGAIRVRGATLFEGYLTPEGLHRPLDEAGWFPTGDMGRVDPSGYLYVLGRQDHMFVSGGENVHPEAIEAALCAVPGVRRALVVPVPDPEFGARPVAFIDGEGAERDRSYWLERLREHLPRFMVPVAFYAWPEEGMGPGFKPSRRVFEALARQRRTDATHDPA